jgi:hypothetical protein
LKPVAAPGLRTTRVPRGDGGRSACPARFMRGSRENWCATPESFAEEACARAAAAILASGADVP